MLHCYFQDYLHDLSSCCSAVCWNGVLPSIHPSSERAPVWGHRVAGIIPARGRVHPEPVASLLQGGNVLLSVVSAYSAPGHHGLLYYWSVNVQMDVMRKSLCFCKTKTRNRLKSSRKQRHVILTYTHLDGKPNLGKEWNPSWLPCPPRSALKSEVPSPRCSPVATWKEITLSRQLWSESCHLSSVSCTSANCFLIEVRCVGVVGQSVGGEIKLPWWLSAPISKEPIISEAAILNSRDNERWVCINADWHAAVRPSIRIGGDSRDG